MACGRDGFDEKEAGVMSDVVAEAKEVLDGVTTGPWDVRDDFRDEITVGAGSYLENPGIYNPADLIVEYDVYGDEDQDREQRFRDARFIAAARQLVPALVERVEQLQAELDTAHADSGSR